MRTIASFAAAAAIVVASAAPAAAQSKTDVYEVTFQSVVNSCDGSGIDLDKGKVTLTQRGRTSKTLTVKVPSIPVMTGTVGKGGKFKAKAKRGRTDVAGLEGKFSIAGTTKGRSIEFVFIAEFFKGKSPLCTQSWKGKGTRTTGGAKSTWLRRLIEVPAARLTLARL